MSTAKLNPRSTFVAARLLLAAAVIVSASTARADVIYSIINYPLSQSDTIRPGTDTVSGTITTDGTLGVLSPTNLVAVTISYEWPGGGYTSSDYTENLVEGAVATPTALLLPAGATFNIVCSDVSLMYGDAWVYGQMVYQGCVWQDPSTDTLASSFFDAGGETAPGYIGANNPWVIATAVPEPGTLTLLVSALLGLVGAFCLRRRRAKA